VVALLAVVGIGLFPGPFIDMSLKAAQSLMGAGVVGR
jgi:hypothetical protein